MLLLAVLVPLLAGPSALPEGVCCCGRRVAEPSRLREGPSDGGADRPRMGSVGMFKPMLRRTGVTSPARDDACHVSQGDLHNRACWMHTSLSLMSCSQAEGTFVVAPPR